MPTSSRLEYLYSKCIRGLASTEEHAELLRWLTDPENETESRELISRAFHEEKPLADMAPETAGDILKVILKSGQQPAVVLKPKPSVFIRKWWAAAAILIVGLGCYLLFFPKSQNRSAEAEASHPKTDVAPGGSRAVLTLANGTKILLNTAQNGILAHQGNTKIVKTDSGRVSYHNLREASSVVLYNTLSTPRGGQFQLVLPDGSGVWLNAASSITFPTAFTSKERRVTVSGEAYFEVAHDAAKPFVVDAGGEELHILGTHFNVNAYSDENSVWTTLLEGSLKVTAPGSGNSFIIRPGQQTQLTDTRLSVMNDVNTDEVIAWKDGLFHFESTDLKTVLREFGRWYDVEVMYAGAVPKDKFFCIMKRNSSLASVLKALQANGIGIKFRIADKKLIVQPG